jgi:tRNA A22 N-methylase
MNKQPNIITVCDNGKAKQIDVNTLSDTDKISICGMGGEQLYLTVKQLKDIGMIPVE